MFDFIGAWRSGSAPALGAGGRRFKSCRPDHFSSMYNDIMEEKIKILFDTDIGNDIDDAFALAYLLAQEKCDLLGITTVSGDTHKRAKLASVFCK